MKNTKLKTKIQESITNLNTFGRIPADEVQLNLDVAYNSILDEICSVVPMNSPRQIISYLRLKHGTQQKAIYKKTDVIDASLMENTGAMPLNEFGYVTDEVEFTVSENKFIGTFKNIVPGTIRVGGNIKDDFDGNLTDSNGTVVGTVDYNKAMFTIQNDIANETTVKYKFDIYNLETSRNMVYFEKASTEVFANMFQLDVDNAITLNDAKLINLQQNIDKLLPEVLAQQIDSYVLSKYFELAESGIIRNKKWDAKEGTTWSSTNGYSVSDFYADFGTSVGLEMGVFTSRTGVIPNIIICDSMGLSLLRTNIGFKLLDKEDANDIKYAGTPRLVGYFSTAKVFVTNYQHDEKTGHVIITYKGPSDAQSASVYAPFVPVTLRTETGAEGGGMIVTNNIYSIGGFKFINTDLVSCVTANNIFSI